MKKATTLKVIATVILAATPAFAAPKKLVVSSSSFTKGEIIPNEYSCLGSDVSPSISWGAVPKGTKAIAVVLSDPDAPGGTFFHWGRYNIDPKVKVLDIGAPKASAKESLNDFMNPGYNGPCPPFEQTHRYNFTVFALSKKVSGVKTAMDLYLGLTKGKLKSSVLASGSYGGKFVIHLSSLDQDQCLNLGATWSCRTADGQTTCECKE